MSEENLNIVLLSEEQQKSLYGGEVLTLTLVLTVTAIAIITVIVWKLYTSKKGKVTFPGGFLFEWGTQVNTLHEKIFNLFR